MISLPYDSCFGCYGCKNICPKDAISLIPDKFGFKHPNINNTKCIECHLCEKVCTSINPLELQTPKEILAAVTKNSDELKTVASGGICTIISKKIIDEGGSVYGCSQKNYMDICHIRINRTDDLDLLKKSKYVYSEIRNSYTQVKEDLKSGKKVLFVGTPCQVSGLLGFLRKPFENLYTIDLVCHGVPSQQMLRDHIDSLKITDKINKKNLRVEFRWKSRYGIRYGIRFGRGNGQFYERHEIIDPYMAAFHDGISYRENCYSCPFAKSKRIGDITAADFWGIGKLIKSEFVDINGVSLVLLNTNKGEKLFNTVSDKVITEVHTIEEAKLNNLNLSQPAPRLPMRDKFLEIYSKKGIAEAARATLPGYRRNINPIYRFLRSLPFSKKIYISLKNFFNK